MTPARTLALALLTLLASAPALAGGDPSDGHSHGEETGGATSSVGAGSVTTSALTPRFEVVLKHAPVRGGDPYTGTLYLVDFATNRPIVGATVDLQAPGVPGGPFTVEATGEPGVYAVARPGGFPRDGRYDLAASVRAGDVSDLVLLSGLYVGEVVEPVAARAGDLSGGGAFPWVWVLVVAALGSGFVAFLVRSARARREFPPSGGGPPSTPPPPVPAVRRHVPEPSLS